MWWFSRLFMTRRYYGPRGQLRGYSRYGFGRPLRSRLPARSSKPKQSKTSKERGTPDSGPGCLLGGFLLLLVFTGLVEVPLSLIQHGDTLGQIVGVCWFASYPILIMTAIIRHGQIHPKPPKPDPRQMDLREVALKEHWG